MLDLKREHIDKDNELREEPRIEFHFPVTIIGFDTKACVVDFSLSGFFIETDLSRMPNPGQKVNIALKLPFEQKTITVRAEVVYRAGKGFGCKLCNPSDENREALERCFTVFSGTLPVLVTSNDQNQQHFAA